MLVTIYLKDDKHRNYIKVSNISKVHTYGDGEEVVKIVDENNGIDYILSSEIALIKISF